LVEQLTLNQRVQGSSPCAPTTNPQKEGKVYISRDGAVASEPAKI
jgi:hypothetical protein